MIPVKPQVEPADFNEKVRSPGRDWLQREGITVDAAPRSGKELKPYWRACLKDLWRSYSGICAYLSIYFEYTTGAASVDHFVAKSKHAGDAYEWSNFRLSTLGANRNKNRFDDVLDPFDLYPETFYLELVSGEIYTNTTMCMSYIKLANKTISRLKLNSPDNKKMRQIHYNYYITNDCSEKYMEKHYPFVWYEIVRQGLKRTFQL